MYILVKSALLTENHHFKILIIVHEEGLLNSLLPMTYDLL